MKIQDVIRFIEDAAPRGLQESYDNAGLQVGDIKQTLKKALICIDVTEDVVDEAISIGANLILSHHPLLFKGLKSISGKDYIERSLIKAIKHDICIYSAHTNLDNAWGGVNFKIAKKLGLTDLQILDPKPDSLLKLITFVPSEQADSVRDALFASGAGHIGNYDSCSFSVNGIGSFRANEGAKPFCGEIAKLHAENEVRVEVVLPNFLKASVENALRKAHPYEEPAYDFIALQNKWHHAGSGVVGCFEKPMSETDFLLFVKERFDCGCVKHSMLSGKEIKRVALCGGSASFLIPNAVASGADTYITGEIKYHEYFGYDDQLLLVDIGHYESEQYTMELLAEIISCKNSDFNYELTNVNTNPIKYL